MNKKELIKAIAEKADVYQKDATVVVDALFEVFTETLLKNEEIAIQGFGKFSVTKRIPRNVVNPRTGELMQLPETRNIKFTQGSALKEGLTNG